MGERCFLKAHNESEPIRAGSKASYSVGMAFEIDDQRIPLLWMALFTENDLKTVTVPAHFLEDTAPKVTIPALHAAKAAALETFDRRLPAIKKHVVPAIWPYVKLFRDALSNCESDHVEIDLHALWWIHGQNADMLAGMIKNMLQGFDLDEGWTAAYGDKSIGDTLGLYGLPFLGMPFGGDIELPWVRAGNNNRAELPIDDKFVLSYDADADTALRFAICFKSVWDRLIPETKELLLDRWEYHEYVTIPGSSWNWGPAQRVLSPSRPYLGLLTGIPDALGSSFYGDSGRCLLWSAWAVKRMKDDVLVAFIAELIVRLTLRFVQLPVDEISIARVAQGAMGVDISPLVQWTRDNPQRSSGA